jgi:hypothetical protein
MYKWIDIVMEEDGTKFVARTENDFIEIKTFDDLKLWQKRQRKLWKALDTEPVPQPCPVCGIKARHYESVDKYGCENSKCPLRGFYSLDQWNRISYKKDGE